MNYVTGVCSVTIGTRDRVPVFRNHQLCELAVFVLSEIAHENAMRVHVYCIMPDHVHLLLEPRGTSIVNFVRLLKGRCVARAREAGLVDGSFWQLRFYDHFLRGAETVGSVTQYILMNPVRAGFVDCWGAWSWSGSLVYDRATLREIVGE